MVKFNRLLAAMVASIVELKKAIKGLVVMSQVSLVVADVVIVAIAAKTHCQDINCPSPKRFDSTL